ncbi:Uroporphyrinogen decarboxylase (URO-D) [Moorella glycerini]|uniref:Methylcobalamin:coenzyme M methyltransferase n=1 Tax=Neomoorella stamsii TaxID=1266720 RepID=A0A9X7P6Q4_9FIRM|nr:MULTISPECIES: uroporphyrinogen decarboxylase family protein [Moorella]PRR73973.1 methylcobalamin:coenzyme M methyltransferase [Moorella stamsii]CEP66184.1 Uroporphyrinogen decarboxylase (URO-D) [Moorella glycerini]
MQSRERALMALRHQEPDRVPFDLWGTVTTGIHRIAYRNLLDYLGKTHYEVTVGEVHQQLAAVHEDILQLLKVDFRPVFSKPPRGWQLEFQEDSQYIRFKDQWGIGYRMPRDGGLYFDLETHPFAGFTTPDEVINYKIPDPADPSRLEGVEEEARRLAETTGAALCLAGVSAGFLEMAYWLRGYENFFVDLACDPKMANAILDKTVQIKIKYWEAALSKLGHLVDVVVEADDFASQFGMIISPDTYRRYIKPRQKELFGTIKKYSNAYICFHSCGAVYEIIPDLIEAGIDALNPVQVSAKNMDTNRLKKEFGDVLTFWGGGVDTQQVLNHGTPQQVKDEVKRRIDDLAPGGGFVFTPVHNVQPDVPPENYMAMWEAWEEYGKYR